MNEPMNEPPDLTPAQEESVRRLLADARVTEPMPDDVLDRLDGLVRGLADERSTEQSELEPDGDVVDLAARRRHRVRNLLVAAAAVVAIGVAVPPLLQGMGGTMDSGSDSAGGSTEMQQAEPNADEDSAAESAPGPAQARSAMPRIRAGLFESDAEAARDRADAGNLSADTLFTYGCLPSVDLGPSTRQIPVRFEGQDALLVLEPVLGNSQRASLYVCGESTPRRTALLDAR